MILAKVGQENSFSYVNITGYGMINLNIDTSRILKAATMWLLPHSYCSGWAGIKGYFTDYDSTTMLCAGYYGDTTISPCFGDSGGGLVGWRPDGSRVLLGIISKNPRWILDYSLCNKFMHYMKVSSYLDWINTFIHTKPSILS